MNLHKDKIPASALSISELTDLITSFGEKPFRAKQAKYALDKGAARTWEDINVLPKELRQKLNETLPLISSSIERIHRSKDFSIKFEIKLKDSEIIEAALIPSFRRVTLCISTQVGCPVGCAFCASGASGFKRNLEAHEIFEQGILANQFVNKESNKESRITHIVVMGIGEPLLNLDNVLVALERFRLEKGFSIGARRVVISTVGIIEGIKKLSTYTPFLNLAISLHTPFQEQRDELVPWAKKYRIKDIVSAAYQYQERTGRQVTFEYVLIKDVNTSSRHAERLSNLLKGKGFHVNLIPYNKIEGKQFEAPTRKEINNFIRILSRKKISVSVRNSRGKDTGAACGQLRYKKAST